MIDWQPGRRFAKAGHSSFLGYTANAEKTPRTTRDSRRVHPTRVRIAGRLGRGHLFCRGNPVSKRTVPDDPPTSVPLAVTWSVRPVPAARSGWSASAPESARSSRRLGTSKVRNSIGYSRTDCIDPPVPIPTTGNRWPNPSSPVRGPPTASFSCFEPPKKALPSYCASRSRHVTAAHDPRTVLKASQLYNAPSDVQIVPFFSQAKLFGATNDGSLQARFPT